MSWITRSLALLLAALLTVLPVVPALAQDFGEGAEKVVATGTVSNADMTVTLTAGSADIDLSSATIPRNYRGHKLRICDSSTPVHCIIGFVYTDGAGTVQNIVSAKGGTTRNWTVQEVGFNDDDAGGYAYTIIRVWANPIVASGTCTAANNRLASVALGAFWWCEGTDLSAYASSATNSYLLGLYDSTGKLVALAYTGAVGAGETLTDIISGATLNGNMETGTPGAPSTWGAIGGATLTSVADERTGGAGATSMGITTGSASVGADQTIATVNGALYKVGFWGKRGTSTNTSLQMFGVAVMSSTSATWESKTGYRTGNATSSTVRLALSGAGVTGQFDDVYTGRVTAAAATGFSLRNAPALGGAQSLITSTVGANPNDPAGLTYKISYIGAP